MGRTRGSRDLDERQQKAIINGRRQGYTHEELARQFCVTKSTITKFLKRWSVQEDYVKKPRSGRPRITNILVDRNIVRTSRNNPRLTASDIAREIWSPNEPNPSLRTIRRRLQSANLHGRRPVKKPFISAKNRKARIEWARTHLHWTRAQWETVIWSDESKFCLYGTDGIKWIRRPHGQRFDPKYQIPTMKHGGGSCMVWGCFSAKGMGPLHHIVGTMDRHMYLDILKNVMLPYALRSFRRRFIFQDDNDPKHQSRDVKAWFDQRRVTRMEWPSQSPDLNIIEHLWEELQKCLVGQRAKNVAEKFMQLEETWKKITQATINELIDSMPRRCQAVIDAKGYATKY